MTNRAGAVEAAISARSLHVAQQAVADPVTDEAAHADHLTNLCVVLRLRLRRSSEDLHGAITAGRAAVLAGGSSPGRQPGRLSNLGSALRLQAQGSGDPALHDDAVEALSSAVHAAGPDNAQLPTYLTNLAVAGLNVSRRERPRRFGTVPQVRPSSRIDGGPGGWVLRPR